MYKKFIQFLSKPTASFLIFMLYMIRPQLGPMNICPFPVGCTQYAVAQLEQETLFKALKNIFLRIIQCHPFGNRKL